MPARRLNTLSDLRRYLAHVINEIESDRMTPDKGGKLGYLVNIQRAVISEGDLELRVKLLEERIKTGVK
ncbi:MAG: hypothetical protein HQK99_16745 [Nitrospirae bacterium]|nr:hypothetical protein [Nitrospirota bacterium]